jgi:hypothetical protein
MENAARSKGYMFAAICSVIASLCFFVLMAQSAIEHSYGRLVFYSLLCLVNVLLADSHYNKYRQLR